MIRKIAAILIAAAMLTSLPAIPAFAQEDAPDGDIRIAFIDSGISTRHIDPEKVASGKNYVFPESDTQDRIGHGTAVASLVLGSEDQGVTGVFPDAVAVPLVVVDVYPSGVSKNGGTEALCAAIYDAVDEFGCSVINVSLSAAQDSEELRSAVQYAEDRGVQIVSAVGNDGPGGQTCYPAAYDTVVAVGAAEGDRQAKFTQPGADVVTGGVGLTAATNRNSSTPTKVSGTSYSCPVLSGIVAKLMRAYPGLTLPELRDALRFLAEDIGEEGYDAFTGWGLIRADLVIPTPFLDVPDDAWYAPGVSFAYENGMMNGTGAGKFSPDGTATRAAVITILWRMSGSPSVERELTFSDVDDAAWYAGAVRWAVSTGVMTGYSEDEFGPDDRVSREQLAVIIYRYTDASISEETVLERFEDLADLSDWARNGMGWAVSLGIINGTDETTLSPRSGATRAQLAAILQRYCSAVTQAETEEPSEIGETAPPEETAEPTEDPDITENEP